MEYLEFYYVYDILLPDDRVFFGATTADVCSIVSMLKNEGIQHSDLRWGMRPAWFRPKDILLHQTLLTVLKDLINERFIKK